MSDYDSIKETLLKSLKRYGLEETDNKTIQIYQEYLKNCAWFQEYVTGNLDTFKKAACVMSAILKCKIVAEETENDKVALDISLSLIENPSYYSGEKYNEEISMSSISIKKLRENSYLWENFCSYTLNVIQLNRERKESDPEKYGNLEEINIMSQAEDFYLLYQTVLCTQNPIKFYEIPIQQEENQRKPGNKKTKWKKQFTKKS